MNPEIKQLWVDALRSGNYEQGEQVLRLGDRFCCLGVLCDIIEPNNWAPMSRTKQTQPVYSHRPYLDKETYFEDLPSVEVANWAGLHERDPLINIDDAHLTSEELNSLITYANHDDLDNGRCRLSSLNDAGIPFTRIADLIEAQL